MFLYKFDCTHIGKLVQVSIEDAWKYYNMNPQKLEQLLHNFFGNSCLDIDVFDQKGKRHTPNRRIGLTDQIVFVDDNPVLNFSKYNGKKLTDEKDFCKWILSADFDQEIKEFIRSVI